MRILCCCLLALLLGVPAARWAQTPATKKQTGNPPAQPAAKPTPTPTPRPAESFAQKLLRFLGLTVTPNALKGEEEDALSGDLWLTDLPTGLSRRLTFDGGYRSPLVLPGEQAVWALKGETIFEIPAAGGVPQTRFTITGIVKLAGVVDDTGKQLVVLREDSQRQIVVELLSLADGKRTALPYDAKADADTRMLAYLRGWERSYDEGKFRLYTQLDLQTGQRNVYLKEAERDARKVSHCADAHCGQPALAVKTRFVVFIKGPLRP